MEAVPGKHSIDSLQKTAILGTSHIIRKVLQCEAWRWAVGITAGSREVPGRKGLWQETMMMRLMMMIIIVIITLIMFRPVFRPSSGWCYYQTTSADRNLFSRRWRWRHVNLTTAYSAKFKNAWSCTSTVPFILALDCAQERLAFVCAV